MAGWGYRGVRGVVQGVQGVQRPLLGVGGQRQRAADGWMGVHGGEGRGTEGTGCTEASSRGQRVPPVRCRWLDGGTGGVRSVVQGVQGVQRPLLGVGGHRQCAADGWMGVQGGEGRGTGGTGCTEASSRGRRAPSARCRWLDGGMQGGEGVRGAVQGVQPSSRGWRAASARCRWLDGGTQGVRAEGRRAGGTGDRGLSGSEGTVSVADG